MDDNVPGLQTSDMAEISVEMDIGSESKNYVLKIHGPMAPEAVTLMKNAVEDAKMRRERGAKDTFS